MDLIDRDDIRTLLAQRQTPCVSLLMPTARLQGVEDKTHFRNLIREAERRLTGQGERRSEAAGLLDPARALLDDAPFWLNVSHGLAVYLAPGTSRTFRLPIALDEQVVVGSHFHVKPLVSLLGGDGRFYVLAISRKNVRLFRGSRDTVAEVELQGVPTNFEEALQYDVEGPARNVVDTASSGGDNPRHEAQSEGQGTGMDTRKAGLLEYFRQVDRGLHRYLHDEQAPLVLAAVDFLHPIYRQANSYAHLLEEGIKGGPDRWSAQELHARAWPIVQPVLRQRQERMTALYRQLAGTGRTADDVAALLAAAHQGHIQYLFAAVDRALWGTFDPQTQQVEVHDRQQPEDEDLVNLAVVYTLAHKGTVYTFGPDHAPNASPLAAIYWLPLGQRSGKRTVETVPAGPARRT
jgi:hypothetical protein